MTIVQRSPEWYQARLGKCTASRVADATARTKTGWGASRANYATELILERLTGIPTDSYVNGPMQFGIDNEPAARAAYSFYRDVDIEEVGFVEHPKIAMAGCSPDGFIGEAGLVEFKVPNSTTHIATLLGAAVPEKYLKQMQFQMACTGRQWCDFVSFDPRLPEAMQIHVMRIKRDLKRIAELEKQVTEFLAEIDDTLAKLRERFEGAPSVLERQLQGSLEGMR